MKRLLIVGAGGFGREVFDWANDVDPEQRDWQVSSFLDSSSNALDNFSHSCSEGVVGDPLNFEFSDNDRVICAIGNPKTRLMICQKLKERGAQFVTLRHPTAIIGSGCRVGEGSILCPGAILTNNVSLGDFCVVNIHSTIGHDAVLGEGCTLSAHCDVTGHATLGKGVFMGSHASILPSAVVGDFSVIGAGSVVLRKVAPHVTVMGVPARQIAGFTKT